MNANTIIARVPLDYANFGEYTLTEAGLEKYESILASKLPSDVYWCGGEFIAPADRYYRTEAGFEFRESLDSLISSAKREFMLVYGDTDEYWEAE